MFLCGYSWFGSMRQRRGAPTPRALRCSARSPWRCCARRAATPWLQGDVRALPVEWRSETESATARGHCLRLGPIAAKRKTAVRVDDRQQAGLTGSSRFSVGRPQGAHASECSEQRQSSSALLCEGSEGSRVRLANTNTTPSDVQAILFHFFGLSPRSPPCSSVRRGGQET